jgi:acetylornithine/N-succinyldiaminopimelate aminotransferase
MFDEVQCGNGRTGSHFYFQQTRCDAGRADHRQGLGNGVPIGACLARGAVAETFAPGHHGSTYGGNPLACAAAGAVLDALTEGCADGAGAPVAPDPRQLRGLAHGDARRDVRGAGLMIGIELDRDCGELAARALDAGC